MRITPRISLSPAEIRIEPCLGRGPGGQHVNRTESAVQLRFDVPASSLPPEVKARVLRLAGQRATADGVVIIKATTHRSQHRNRREALDRLATLIRNAAIRPRVRRPTRPTRASTERRLNSKRRRGEVKRGRGRPSHEA